MHDAVKNGRAKKRARRSRVEWSEEVRRWRESGQSATEYARERGIHAGTLAGWASKLRDSIVAKAVGGQRRSMFVPVHVAPVASAAARAGTDCGLVEVVLRNGRRIRITGTFDGEAVARLLTIAEGAAC
jgi:transposase